MTIIQELKQLFSAHFNTSPSHIVRAPGRVNLIGEHTDYNDGFVLPMAIEHAIYIALRAREDDMVRIYASNFDNTFSFELDNFSKGEMSPAEYVKGMTRALQNAEYALQGWDGVLKGDIPIGAGLSSSAATEMAIGQAFKAVGSVDATPTELAKMGQWVENEWLGLGSGIMDQMISASGQVGSALLIDCRSLETENVPLPENTAVVILDTGTRRGLVDSKYNERRQQCEEAAAFFGVPKLRDVIIEQFEARENQLDEMPRKRARHVITENARVLKARDALKGGDAATFGKLMDESHMSMRDDFEISSDALNAMVRHAQMHPACYGARMTGGGFAGCAVALVNRDGADDFARTVTAGYGAETGHTPAAYISQPTQGA
ncbi:MAG: galactokinase, partial [Chloroflexota bacterium]